MKIYFDISTLDPRKITGIGVYTMEILRHLQSEKTLEAVPVIKVSRYKRKKVLEKFLGCKVKILWPWTGLFEKNCLYHGPDFKINLGSHIPRVVSIHDLVVFERKYNHPDFCQKSIESFTRNLKRSPQAILTISQFTKTEIIKRFPGLKDRIHVTHLGSDRTKKISHTEAPCLQSDYILYLGTLEKRKNIVGVIKSFEILCQQGRPESLVLAGAWGYGAEEIQKALTMSPYKNRIFHLNYVSDEKALGLFKNASVFIFPSWYEGFGLPTLDAMAMGCPVVTASGGALEEITGGAALLAPPDRPELIASQVFSILTDKNLREDLIRKGFQKASEFYWKKCFAETLHVYKKVLGDSTPS